MIPSRGGHHNRAVSSRALPRALALLRLRAVPPLRLRAVAPCLSSLLVASAAAAQTLPLPADAPTLEPSAPAIAYLDWGIGVVGNEVVTLREIERAEADPYAPWQARLREGEDRGVVREDILRDLAMTRLEVEAGRSRGFDPALVESLVSGHFERQVERFGGAAGFSQRLRSSRTSPEQFREQVTADLYRIAWRDSERGVQPGPAGRTTADRYIRPGELLSAYEVLKESQDPDDLALVGAKASSFSLKRMILSLEEHAPGLEGQAAVEKVVFLANQLRGQVALGDASFPEQVEAWDAMRGRSADLERSLQGMLIMSRSLHGGDALYEFGRTARVGDLTPPLPYLVEGSVRAIVLYQVTGKNEAVPAEPFSSLEVQERLREHLLEELDQRRLVRSRLGLVRGSFVFPQDLQSFLARGEIESTRR